MNEGQDKTIELRKQSFLNGDVVVGVLLCAAILVRRYLQSGGEQACYLLLAGVVFVPLVFRKFARSIAVDFAARTIRSIGIVSLFRQSYTFDDLDYVRCPATIGLDTSTSFNVVFRRQGAIQPIIFEARSEAERTQARQLLDALRAAVPNKVRDDELS
jgi:hypothetical protein